MSLYRNTTYKFILFSVLLIVGGLFGLTCLLASEMKVPEEMLYTPKPDLLNLGNKYMAAGKIDSAMIVYSTVVSYDNLDQSGSKANNEDVKAMAQAYINLGKIHHNLKSASSKYLSYAKAYRYYSRAVALGEEYNLDEELAQAYLELGVLYSTMGYAYEDDTLLDMIMSLYRRSLEKAIAVGNIDLMDMAAKNLSTECFLHKSFDGEASLLESYFKRSRALSSESKSSAATRALCQALRSLSQGNSSRAVAYADTMLSYSAGHPVHKIEAYSLLAEILASEKDYGHALVMLDSARVAAEQVDDLWINLQILNGMSELLRQSGSETRADSCLAEANRVRKKMLTEGSVGKVKDLHFTNQIDDLNSELTRLSLERKYTRLILAIVSVAFLIIAAMLIIIWNAYKKLKESQRHIYMEYTRRLKEEGQAMPLFACEETAAALYSAEIDNKSDNDTPGEAGNAVEDETGTTDSGKRYQGRQLSEEEKDLILQRIKSVLSDADTVSQTKFQIKDLADKVGVSQRLVSQVINDKLNCNFSTVLAEYRIKEICRRISSSPTFRKLTVEAMAESGGFQSRSYFSTTFKKVTGLTPSAFIRQAIINDMHDKND